MLHAGGASIPHLHNLALAPLNIRGVFIHSWRGRASIPHLHNLALAPLKCGSTKYLTPGIPAVRIDQRSVTSLY